MNKFLERLILVMALFVAFTHTADAQWATNGPYGGSVYSLAVSGNNIFAATKFGGVFLSTNNGTSWTAANTGLPTTSTVTILASSGGNILAGTDVRLFLSTNNGASWTAVSTDFTKNYSPRICRKRQ